MGTRPAETTNGKLAEVIAEIDVLISWAEADADHATENDASETAKDDRARAKLLQRARQLLQQCER